MIFVANRVHTIRYISEMVLYVHISCISLLI